MKIGIVDDEFKETELLSGFLRKYGREKELGMQIKVFHQAQEFLDQYSPDYDIVFMDIQMPGIMDGMETARELRKRDESVVIVFVTKMAQYAINGYEVGAVDFVLKPVTYMEFALKMSKAIRYVDRNRDKKIMLQTVDGIIYIKISEIHYIEVIRHYLIYHTSMGEFKVRGTMKDTEKEMKPFLFYRINNGYLVNLKYVDTLNGNTVTVSGDELVVSRGKKTEFMQALLKYMGGMKVWDI